VQKLQPAAFVYRGGNALKGTGQRVNRLVIGRSMCCAA
jgi:hypothetical protein